MNFIKGLDVKVHEWLSNVPPSTWFRSHFSTKSKCDILVNNPFESFNSYIILTRFLEPIWLLDVENVIKLEVGGGGK